jgi:hypothetical protein
METIINQRIDTILISRSPIPARHTGGIPGANLLGELPLGQALPTTAASPASPPTDRR